MLDSEDYITQESFVNGVNLSLLEASLEEGQTRSNDPVADLQSSVIIDRGRSSDYKVQALLKTCIHGVLDAGSNTPASLIIVDYSLFNLKENGRFSSATVTLDFSTCPSTSDGEDADEGPSILHTPNVVAYAPFDEPQRYNTTTGQKESKHGVEADIEPEVGGFKAGRVGYSHESTRSHEQKYFSQGTAGRNFMPPGPARHIAQRVWWNFQHDFSQKSGISPHFRIAVLITRPQAAAEDKFLVKFNIVVRGGIGMKWSEMVDKLTRRNGPEKPYLFDPSSPVVGEPLDGLQPNDKGVYELGHLAKSRRITKLSYVWGLDPLLEQV
jgi:hypothetical protein